MDVINIDGLAQYKQLRNNDGYGDKKSSYGESDCTLSFFESRETMIERWVSRGMPKGIQNQHRFWNEDQVRGQVP